MPSTHKIGGVLIKGDIRRDFSLNLSVLRALKGTDKPETMKLQRYVLSLALIALTASPESTFRQGCQLLPKGVASWKQFLADGKDSDWDPSSFKINDFALDAASKFGIEQPNGQPLVFDKNLLKSSIETDAKRKADKKRETASDPLETIRELVGELVPVKGDKFSEAKTFTLSKLKDVVAGLQKDSNCSDELRKLLVELQPFLIAGIGAIERKSKMIAMFPTVVAPESPSSSIDA